MPITAPFSFKSGSPGCWFTAVAVEVIPGIPLAHPLAIAVSTAVTVPPSQCSVTVAAVGVSTLNVITAFPADSAASSANGATGTASGTLTRATSDAVSTPTSDARKVRPSLATMEMLRSPDRASAVVATRPPSATATPTRETTPWLVTARSWTIEWPAACASVGTVSLRAASVVTGTSDAIALDGEGPVWSEAGESNTMAHATAARVAAAPINRVVRGWRLRSGRVPVALVARAASSLGCRQRRSSGSIQPAQTRGRRHRGICPNCPGPVPLPVAPRG